MTSPKVFMVTKEGLKNLQADLEHLQTVRRKEIAGKIREAKEFGDLSENAEYHDAKNEQALVESEILDLESKIKNSKIIDKSTKSSNVQIGSKVVLINLETKEELTLDLVGSMEADVFNHKISNESPLGMAILDKTKGEIVTVAAPKGSVKFEIVKFS
jgi:transcription elongation factor GreA